MKFCLPAVARYWETPKEQHLQQRTPQEKQWFTRWSTKDNSGMSHFTFSANGPHKLFGSYLVLVLLYFLICNKFPPIRRKISIQTFKMPWMPVASIKHFELIKADVEVLVGCFISGFVFFCGFFFVCLFFCGVFLSYSWKKNKKVLLFLLLMN